MLVLCVPYPSGALAQPPALRRADLLSETLVAENGSVSANDASGLSHVACRYQGVAV